MGKISALQLTYGAIFVCLMAIGSNIVIWFPFLALPIGGVTVPLSLQTFFAILAGLILGKKLGFFSMLAYLLVGLAGVPVFAQMQAGLFVLFNYTGGFLLSFLFVAYVTGKLNEKLDHFTFNKGIIIALIGVLVNYLIGVNYMFLSMNTWLGLSINYSTTWISMFPFLFKDMIVAIIAAGLMLKITKRLPNQLLKVKM